MLAGPERYSRRREQTPIVESPTGLNIGEGRCAGWFHDNRVTGNECGTDLVAKQRYGEIPRHDRTTHTDRPLDDHAVPLLVQRRDVAAADALAQTCIVFERVCEAANLPGWLPGRLAPVPASANAPVLFRDPSTDLQLCTKCRRAAAAPLAAHFLKAPMAASIALSTSCPRRHGYAIHHLTGRRIPDFAYPAVRSVSLFTCNDQFCHNAFAHCSVVLSPRIFHLSWNE